jgi:beta-xylosidase
VDGVVTYYLYPTTGTTSFSTWSSPDLVNWTSRGVVYNPATDPNNWGRTTTKVSVTNPGNNFGGSFWAPEVIKHNGLYYLYYSCNRQSYNGQELDQTMVPGSSYFDQPMRIGVAVSSSPTGPFLNPQKKPLLGDEDGFNYTAIDAHVFIDDNGKAYLYYARGFRPLLAGDSGSRIGTTWVVELNDDLTSVKPETAREVLRPGQVETRTNPTSSTWTNRYCAAGQNQGVASQCLSQNRLCTDNTCLGWESVTGTWRWSEGPEMLKHDGKYYLTYSSGVYTQKNYAVGYAVSDSPFGPFTKPANNRILFWEDMPGKEARTPDAVLAQPAFTANGENRWAGVTRDTLCWPYGLSLHGDRLAVADSVLSKHLSRLESTGLVHLDKATARGHLRTWVALTPQGRADYDAHIAALRKIAGL